MENPFSFSYVSKMTEAQRQKAFSFQGMTKKELIAYSKDLGLSGLTKYRHLEIVKRICDAEFKIEGNHPKGRIDVLFSDLSSIEDKIIDCKKLMEKLTAEKSSKESEIKKERNLIFEWWC